MVESVTSGKTDESLVVCVLDDYALITVLLFLVGVSLAVVAVVVVVVVLDGAKNPSSPILV